MSPTRVSRARRAVAIHMIVSVAAAVAHGGVRPMASSPPAYQHGRLVPATGACCHEYVCAVLTAADCASTEGMYFGDGTGCEPNPCVPYGACCDDVAGACIANVAVTDCAGRFLDLANCDAFWPPCGYAPGACCRGDGSCDFVTYDECATGIVGCKGDLNCDGVIDYRDVDPLVLAFAGVSPYLTAFPTCHWLNGDCDGDGDVDFFDIDYFVALLGTQCAPTAAPGAWLGAGTRCDACRVGIPIPPGAIPEGEPCGSDSNGGCVGAPPAFELLSPGETVHGTLYASPSALDEDWYTFTISGVEPKWVLWLATAELPVELVLLQPDALDCATPLATALAAAGAPNAIEFYLVPGTYYAMIRPAAPGDEPCGDYSDYVAFLAADNEPKCQVSVSAGPHCLCKDRTEFWNAHWYPGGGTLKWTVTAGNDKLQIVQPDNTPNGNARGVALSAAVGDANLRVTYTTPQGEVCHGDRAITVIECALSFRANGQWDGDNAVARQARVGNPRLGTITPGNPEGASAWVKSMEIKGTISPCIAGLPCHYDFKREYRGRSGTIVPNVGFRAARDDSPNDWRNDDSHDTDEDLTLDAPPKCTIFVVDTPGFLVGAECAQAEAGHILLQCINFREWLNVDLRRCSSNFEWYTSTRIRCNPNNLRWEANNGGQGNAIAEGSINCGTTALEVDEAPLPQFNGNWALAARMIGSEWAADRLAADAVIRAAIDARALSDAEIELIVGELLPLTYGEAVQVWSSPLLAIELLARLGAIEVAGPALDRLLEQFPRPIVHRRELIVTPAADALTRLGPKAVPLIAARAASMDEAEWAMARRALRAMRDFEGMRDAVRAARDAATDGITRERLESALAPRHVPAE